MSTLEIALLGQLRVTCDGQLVTNFGYDKVRALLAYLVVEARHPHDRSALAALLWPSEPDSVARKNLRTALATLRQAINDSGVDPPLLHISRASIQFNQASDHLVDLAMFAGLLAEVEQHRHADCAICATCAAKLTQGAELYRSEFAQGIEVANSVAWEEWVLLIRERLRSQLLDVLALLMDYHEQSGEDASARQYAWRALGLEAWDETAHRCLMRIYVRNGQRTAALAQYERCQHVLANQLGVVPAAETTALAERIRKGPLARAAGTPTHEAQRRTRA